MMAGEMVGEMAGKMAEKTADVKSDGVPNDLFHEIFLRLPAKSIARFRCVSKSWLSITTSPSFLFAHTSCSPHSLLTHSSTCNFNFSYNLSINLHLLSPAPNPPDGRIIVSSTLPEKRRSMSEVVFASCDGLICLCEKFINSHTRLRVKIKKEKVPCYYVLNPLTGSRINLKMTYRFPGVIMGLYYHPPTCEYRLIRRIYSNYFNKIQLLTLGGEAWRTIESSLPEELVCGSASINLKGNLYWVSYNTLNGFGVLAFDTFKEKFKLLPMPPGYRPLNLCYCLIEIRERLGVSIVDKNLNSAYELGIDIWFLKGDEWEKMHSVKCSGRPGSINFRMFYMFDDIALFNKEELKVHFFGCSYFVRFDLYSKKYHIEEYLDPQEAMCHSNHLYKESLVSYDSFRNK